MLDILLVMIMIVAVLIIIAVLLQPSQKTGLIGDATDIEKREKRGFELFLYKSTIVLGITFFGLSLIYSAGAAGLF